MTDWQPMALNASQMLIILMLELSLLFLLISTGVNRIRSSVPDHRIQTVLSSRRGKGYLIASLLGAITPFCSCSTIPMLRGLLQARAGFGPTLTFLFVSPLLNPIIVGLMWMTFGWQITALYALIAVTVSVVAGWLLNALQFQRFVIPVAYKPASSGACCTSPARAGQVAAARLHNKRPMQASSFTPSVKRCFATADTLSNHARRCCKPQAAVHPRPRELWRRAFADAWQQLVAMAPYLIIGVLVGSLIYGFVPAEWIAQHAGSDNPLAIMISAVIGIPLYIRAEAVIPLASVLLDKGMSTGAVMALIIGSAGASITELILLKSIFRMPMLLAFITVIIGMAISMGYLALLFF